MIAVIVIAAQKGKIVQPLFLPGAAKFQTIVNAVVMMMPQYAVQFAQIQIKIPTNKLQLRSLALLGLLTVIITLTT